MLPQDFLSQIRELIPPQAVKYNSMFRARLVLELYKYSVPEVASNKQILNSEIDRLLREMEWVGEKSPIGFRLPTEKETISLDNAVVKLIPETEAQKIHARFHYPLSPRSGFFHAGLFSENGSLLGLATFSENDLSHLNAAL